LLSRNTLSRHRQTTYYDTRRNLLCKLQSSSKNLSVIRSYYLGLLVGTWGHKPPHFLF